MPFLLRSEFRADMIPCRAPRRHALAGRPRQTLKNPAFQPGPLPLEGRSVLAAELADFPTMAGRALVDEVTCAAAYEMPAVGEERRHLAVYDFGVKANILRSLAERGARLTVLPARTPASDVLALGVDGVVLSNGPGDPEPLTGIVDNVRARLPADRPIFGSCLG